MEIVSNDGELWNSEFLKLNKKVFREYFLFSKYIMENPKLLKCCSCCGVLDFKFRFQDNGFGYWTCYDKNDCFNGTNGLRLGKQYNRQLLRYLRVHPNYNKMIVWMLLNKRKHPDMYDECYQIVSNLDDVNSMVEFEEMNILLKYQKSKPKETKEDLLYSQS